VKTSFCSVLKLRSHNSTDHFKILARSSTLLPHRKPPHNFRQRHRLTIRRIHNLTRHRNHNPLPPRPLKPRRYLRFNLCGFRFSALLASLNKHGFRRLDSFPSPYCFFQISDRPWYIFPVPLNCPLNLCIESKLWGTNRVFLHKRYTTGNISLVIS
jgi:hypothetical protein